ncbi:MAG: nucleotidyltransferase domain-containing protein [Candidatus Diapherotrites archaeon]|nr:nucleotidyltransferase domain-containing protein [Candidatus Diapherotrites archaeon]
MRFVNALVGSKTKAKLLDFLLGHKKDIYSVSELAKLTRTPKSGVSKVIREWEGSGLIKVTHIGNSKAVSIDQGFFLLPELSKLFSEPQKRAHQYARRFARNLIAKSGKDVSALVVYGSTARREMGALSDIDILVITPSSGAKKRVKEKVLSDAATLKKAVISTVVMTKKEAGARLKEGDRFIFNILSEGEALAGGEYIEHLKRAL